MLINATQPLPGRLFAVLALLFWVHASHAVSVLESRNDRYRTGANTEETVLNTSNVNPKNFGLLWSYAVDGDVYAQPLYVPNVNTAKGVRNVLYVATMNDTLYAFDADSNQTLWVRDFKNPANGVQAFRRWDLTYTADHGIAGIQSTPVIDPVTQTLYVATKTTEKPNVPVHRVWAIDITTGLDRVPSVIVSPSYKGAPFKPFQHNQRVGLVLVNGLVVVCYGRADGSGHGWIVSFDASTLQQRAAYATTTTKIGGGLWASGRAPAVTDDGHVIIFTGNGSINKDGYDGVDNLVESVLKLDPAKPDGMAVDWFTPDNWTYLDEQDLDLSGSGPLILPNGYIVGGGKEGVMYVIDPNNMGKLQPGNPQLIQSFRAVTKRYDGWHHIMAGPVIWDRTAAGQGLTMYHWGETNYLQAYPFNGQTFDTKNVKQGSFFIDKHPGGILSLSANGAAAGTGIVWALGSQLGNAVYRPKQGILLAYDAADVSKPPLWTSRMEKADDSLTFAKFTPPTIANGRVYVATFSNRLMVYGLLPSPRTRTQYLKLVSRVGSVRNVLEVAGASQFPGSRVQINKDNGMARQVWERTFFPDGSYRLQSVLSGLKLDGGSGYPGSQATIASFENPETQGFKLMPSANGYVRLVLPQSNLALTVSDPNGAGGSAVIAMPQTGDPSQDWQVVFNATAGTTECDTKAVQMWANVESWNLPVPYMGGLVSDGTTVWTDLLYPGLSKAWAMFVPLDGKYRFQWLSNYNMLDVLEGGDSDDVSPVNTVMPNGALTQKWQMTTDNNVDSAWAVVNLVSPASGRLLTMGGINKSAAKVASRMPQIVYQNWHIQDRDLRWCKP